MEKFKIAYIDESDEDIRKFQFFADGYFVVSPFKPTHKLEEVIGEIFSAHVDAVVVDFDLREEDTTIQYNGVDLIEEFLKRKEGFPVFILTSFDEQAMEKGDDVNMIYEKKEMYEKNEKFLEKIRHQVIKYRSKIEEAERRLITLLQLKNENKADIGIEQEILDLDHFLESALDKTSSVPKNLKEISNSEKLSQILNKVDELLKKVEKKDE